jgi:hypothetical protein
MHALSDTPALSAQALIGRLEIDQLAFRAGFIMASSIPNRVLKETRER